MPLVLHGSVVQGLALSAAGEVAAIVRNLGGQPQAALRNAVVARLRRNVREMMIMITARDY